MSSTPARSGTAGARLALPMLLAGALGIAFAPIFVRKSEIGPAATAFYRILFALPVLWVWMRADRRWLGSARAPKPGRQLGLCALAGLLFAGDLAVWHWSILLTSVANATVLANLAPIFVTLGGRRLFGERITPTFVAGLAVALLGVCVLLGQSLQLGSGNLLGDALGVLTAVFYAGYLLSVKGLRRTLSAGTVMSWAGVFTAAGLLVVALLSGEGLAAPSLRGWAVLVGLALVSHVGGQGLIAAAFRWLPASFASVSLLLQPAAAAFFGWVLLGERLTLLQGLGGAVIIAGIVLARRGTRL